MTPADLKSARAKLRMTQAELARAMGVPTNTVSQWEQGLRPIKGVAERCVELLLRSPAFARKLARPGSGHSSTRPL